MLRPFFVGSARCTRNVGTETYRNGFPGETQPETRSMNRTFTFSLGGLIILIIIVAIIF